MNFETFFTTKKINIDVIQNVNVALYQKLFNHYQEMGEKSFDYSNKFIFNKLRHLYPLSDKTITIEQADKETTQTKVAYTPRFKSGTAPKA